MGFKLYALLVAGVAALATPAAAQTVDWGSESNRTWWNGVTGAEIRELAAEAGGVWTDVPDGEDYRAGRIDWPGLAGVVVREMDCPTPERPMEERPCRVGDAAGGQRAPGAGRDVSRTKWKPVMA